MNKTITIDGQTFELVPNSSKGLNRLYTLKPIKPVEKEVIRQWDLYFGQPGYKDLVDEHYNLTKPQAHAIAEAIETLLDDLMRDFRKARKLIGDSDE